MAEQKGNLAPEERESDYWRKGKRLLIEIEFTKDVHVYESTIMGSLHAPISKKESEINGEFTVQRIYVGTYKEVTEQFKKEIVQKLDELQR